MEYAKVGSVEYIINEKLSFENGQVISGAIATLRAQNAELREALGRVLRLEEYRFVIPTKETGEDNVKSTIATFDKARAILAKYGDDNA